MTSPPAQGEGFLLSAQTEPLLGIPNAHRGEFILVIKTHWSGGKLMFGNNLSSEGSAVLRITWKPRMRHERSPTVSSSYAMSPGREPPGKPREAAFAFRMERDWCSLRQHMYQNWTERLLQESGPHEVQFPPVADLTHLLPQAPPTLDLWPILRGVTLFVWGSACQV